MYLPSSSYRADCRIQGAIEVPGRSARSPPDKFRSTEVKQTPKHRNSRSSASLLPIDGQNLQHLRGIVCDPVRP